MQTIAQSYWNSRSVPPLHARAPHAYKREIETPEGEPPAREVSACAHCALQAGIDELLFAVRIAGSNCRNGANSAEALPEPGNSQGRFRRLPEDTPSAVASDEAIVGGLAVDVGGPALSGLGLLGAEG